MPIPDYDTSGQQSAGRCTDQHFAVFDVHFTITTSSPTAGALIRRLYHGYEDEHESGCGSRYTVARVASAEHEMWGVYENDGEVARELSLADALGRLEYVVTTRVVAERADLIALHGATVLTPAGALLITGDSGAGKTTLALALHHHGYRVGGDDVAFLEPETGNVQPLPRCIHLDQQSWQLLDALGPWLPAQARRSRFITPVDLGVQAITPQPVHLLILTMLGSDSVPRIEPMPQAEMVVRLLEQARMCAGSAHTTVAQLQALTAAADCYRVISSNLSETAAAVAALTEQSVRAQLRL